MNIDISKSSHLLRHHHLILLIRRTGTYQRHGHFERSDAHGLDKEAR